MRVNPNFRVEENEVWGGEGVQDYLASMVELGLETCRESCCGTISNPKTSQSCCSREGWTFAVKVDKLEKALNEITLWLRLKGKSHGTHTSPLSDGQRQNGWQHCKLGRLSECGCLSFCLFCCRKLRRGDAYVAQRGLRLWSSCFCRPRADIPPSYGFLLMERMQTAIIHLHTSGSLLLVLISSLSTENQSVHIQNWGQEYSPW